MFCYVCAMGKQNIAILLGLIFTAQQSVQAQQFTVPIDNLRVAPAAMPLGQPLKQAETDADLIDRIEILQKTHPNISLKYILLGVSLTALLVNEGFTKLMLSNHEVIQQRLRAYLDRVKGQKPNLEEYNTAIKLHEELVAKQKHLMSEGNKLYQMIDVEVDEIAKKQLEDKFNLVSANRDNVVKQTEHIYNRMIPNVLSKTQISLVRLSEQSELLKRSTNSFERSLGQQLDQIFTSKIGDYTTDEIWKAFKLPNMSAMDSAIAALKKEIQSYEKAIQQVKNMQLQGRIMGAVGVATALYFIFEEMWSDDPTYGGQGVFGRRLSEATTEEKNDLIRTIKESGLTHQQLGDAISSIAGK